MPPAVFSFCRKSPPDLRAIESLRRERAGNSCAGGSDKRRRDRGRIYNRRRFADAGDGGCGAMNEMAQPASEADVLAQAPGIPILAPTRVIAIANQKGGVGKTTTAINLGTALAAVGEQVLILDLDPQGNASTGLGIDRRMRRYSTHDVLMGEATLRDVVLPTAVPRLSIAPSTLDLSGVELEVSQDRERAFRLRTALAPLRTMPRAGDVTYVLIDCPPSLNLLTVNAIAAA